MGKLTWKEKLVKLLGYTAVAVGYIIGLACVVGFWAGVIALALKIVF